MRISVFALVVLACQLVIPSPGYAQGSITGVIRDTSGAVLPGVTVEAASPSLIEKARSVVTDGTGQYRIVDLRPGTYTVTFTLPGFSTVRREGIELSGSFTATVNGELRIGAVEETITVTGETPLVDVQSTMRQRVIGHDVIDAVPTGRLPQQLGVLIPGVSNGGGLSLTGTGGPAGRRRHERQRERAPRGPRRQAVRSAHHAERPEREPVGRSQQHDLHAEHGRHTGSDH